MLKVWTNCKLSLKMQAAFGLVMLIFVAALVAMFVVNQKVAALQNAQNTQLIPARMSIILTELTFRSADDDGAWYIMERRPAPAAAGDMAKYRQDLVTLHEDLDKATKLANSDVQRAALDEYHKFLDGPQGYMQGNEDAFSLKAAGKISAAEKQYVDNS